MNTATPSLKRLLQRWLPLTTVVIAIALAAWQITLSLLVTFDQQLSEDSITAQEERLNFGLYSAFEARQTTIELPVTKPEILRDPFST